MVFSLTSLLPWRKIWSQLILISLISFDLGTTTICCQWYVLFVICSRGGKLCLDEKDHIVALLVQQQWLQVKVWVWKEENFHIFVSDYLFFFTTCKLQYMRCISLYCSGHARVLCACCRENYMWINCWFQLFLNLTCILIEAENSVGKWLFKWINNQILSMIFVTRFSRRKPA